jgi:iron complex transport system ATP-binding protein
VSIRVKNLVFRYRDFSLEVPDLLFEGSKVTSIVGPNGAGKTTLLKCAGAILPVARGACSIDGQDLVRMSARERARRIGYVPQEHGAAFNYVARDFVVMGRAGFLSPFSAPSSKDTRLAEEALEFVGLRHQLHRPYFELSSGERRLVLVARALAQESDILLLDEPTSFLDPRHEVEIMDLAARLAREKKKTILVTLHNLDLAIKYSDRMVVMKGGRVLAYGPPGDILDEKLLEAVYEIKMKLVSFNGTKVILK